MFRLKCPVNEARIGDVLRIFRRDDNNKEMIYTLDNEGISQDSMFLFLGLEKYFPKKRTTRKPVFLFPSWQYYFGVDHPFPENEVLCGKFLVENKIVFLRDFVFKYKQSRKYRYYLICRNNERDNKKL
jgi:hypothetical protein